MSVSSSHSQSQALRSALRTNEAVSCNPLLLLLSFLWSWVHLGITVPFSREHFGGC